MTVQSLKMPNAQGGWSSLDRSLTLSQQRAATCKGSDDHGFCISDAWQGGLGDGECFAPSARAYSGHIWACMGRSRRA